MTASRAATGRTLLDAALAGVRVRVRSALLALRVAATGRLAPIPPIDVVGVAPRPGGCLVAGAARRWRHSSALPVHQVGGCSAGAAQSSRRKRHSSTGGSAPERG